MRYVLHPACRVRSERFGLLFYDLRGPRLLFAETGAVLSPALLQQGVEVAQVLSHQPHDEQARVERLLKSLVTKGFLREQPIC
jgi:putative mycofactocin binding protein MftB